MFIFVFSNKQFLQQINVKMSIYSAGSRTHELSNITTREGSCPAVSLFDNTFMNMQQYVVGVVENFQLLYTGPLWWSSGQRARLPLQRSEFESRWSLQFYL